MWLIFSRWIDKGETTKETDFQGGPGVNAQSIPTRAPTAEALAMLDVLAARYDPPALNILADPSGLTAGGTRNPALGVRVKCNCGLEFPEDSMLEHAESTGHSKPFDMSSVKIGKIWDLEEAVIENASPQCTKCGKPVLGLKRIGKTIYVAHLGCSDAKREDQKSTRPNRQRAKASTCSICWRNIRGKNGVSQVKSVSGKKLMFHEECMRLQSGSQLLAGDLGQRYRRTFKW